MTLANWYETGQIAQNCGTRNYSVQNFKPLMPSRRRRKSRPPQELHLKRWTFALTVLLLLSGVALYSVNLHTIPNPPSHQASSTSPTAPTPLTTSGSPVVFVNPTNISLGSVGTTFTVQIKVANMPQFNGWDIRVAAAPWVINATSLSISGNDFEVNASSGTPFELIHCVNGAGTGCKSSDTAGWVHSSYGNTGVLSGNGLLFTITYQVVGNSGTSQTWYGYSPISLQVLISSPSSSTGVQVTVVDGNYGNLQVISAIGGGTGARHA